MRRSQFPEAGRGRQSDEVVVLSSSDGSVWASCPGAAGPVRLGTHEVVEAVMRDFLAQCECAKRLNRHCGVAPNKRGARTPVERAARALCKLDGQRENVGSQLLWLSYVPQVYAVLGAVVEADALMADAGGKILDFPIGSRAASAMASHVWEAMVDAAFKESVNA